MKEFKTTIIREYSEKELIESMIQMNPEVTGLNDDELEELRLRLECLLFSVESECNKRGLE